MNTFAQKLGRSLWAMTCGWIACNMLLNVTSLLLWKDWYQAGIMAIVYAFYTGFVILVACLVVFLPVDLLLPHDSVWREPGPAALLGFVAGTCVPLVLIWSFVEGSRPWSFTDVLSSFEWPALPWLLSPGITGMVAGWVRSRHGLDTIPGATAKHAGQLPATKHANH